MSDQTEIKFTAAGIDRIKAMVKAASKMRARIGVLGDKAYRATDDGQSNALIGAVHEFGSASRGIPERSFLRVPLQSNLQKAVNASAPEFRAPVQRGDAELLFKRLGKTAERVVKKAFKTSGDGKWAPNAPATIAAKKSDRPLIDTAELRKSIASDVTSL